MKQFKTPQASREQTFEYNAYETLTLVDVATLGLLGLYTFFAIIFYAKIPGVAQYILQNIILATSVLSLCYIAKIKQGRFAIVARPLYLTPMIYLAYFQVQVYVPIVHPIDYDELLIKWDQALFGLNPTEWIGQFTHPALTEYLQFTYMLFFFMPFVQAVELYKRNRFEELEEFSQIIAIGFYASFLLYFIMPAIGPRFTIHDFSALNTELPGLWLTETFREYVNTGGNIPAGTPNPIEAVNRDCMPSAHTMLTLLNIIMALRYKTMLRWVYYISGWSLIIATVYLRYHYVVDLIAGALGAIMVLTAVPRLRIWLRSKGFERA